MLVPVVLYASPEVDLVLPVLDPVVDLVVLAGLGGITLLLYAPISSSTRDSILALAGLSALGSCFLYLVVVRKGVGRHLLVGSLKRFQGAHDAFTHAIQTLCSSPLRAGIHATVSVLIWGLEFLVAWYLALSMGFDLPGWAIIVWIFAANLSKIIPLTPASMGTYEAAGAIALGLAGASYDEAFALVLVEHLLKNSVNLLLGLAFLAVEDLPVLGGDIDTIRANSQTAQPRPDSDNVRIPK